MSRVLSFILLGALLFLAVSASEEETENELVETFEVDPLAEADPTAEARRRRRKKGKKSKKRGKKRGKKKSKRGKKKTRSGKPKARQCRQDDTCLANIVKVLDHVGTIITNFNAQNARQARFTTLSGKKKGKSSGFDTSSALMVSAKNGSSTCGSDAASIETTLKNCSANVNAMCDVPANTVNTTVLSDCNTTFAATKDAATACCAKTSAADKCTCMNALYASALGDTTAAAKVETCRLAGIAANSATKSLKTKCLTAFQACKKAEDSSISEINLCKGGTEPSANTGRRSRMNLRIHA